MGDSGTVDDVRDAVAVERRETLLNPKKEERLGASIMARRPRPDGPGAILDLTLDTTPPGPLEKVTLTWQKQHADGEVLSSRPADDGALAIEVSANKDPGERVRRVQVTARREDLFIALDSALSAIDAEHAGLAPRLLDPSGTPHVLDVPAVTAADLERAAKPWNPAQRRALDTALTHDITYIWGPPGTGKTDLLAALVEGSVRQGHRVLFLAPTNVAVDQALLRICERLENTDGFTTGLVQRQGPLTLPALAQRYGDAIDPGQIRQRLAADLEAQHATLREQREHWEQMQRQAAERARLQQQRHTQVQHHADAKARLRAASGSGPSRLLRRMRGADVPDPDQIPQLAEDIARTVEAITRTDDQLARLPAVHSDEHHASAQIAALDEQLAAVTAQQQRIDSLIQDNLVVAATTLDGAVMRHRKRPPGSVDTVVIDEAGMIPLAKALAAASMAATRIVLIGDFRQLPAVTATTSTNLADPREQGLYRSWYERDVFHAGGVVSDTGRITDSPRLVSLDTQYRMRSDICALVNTVAYPDQPLRTGRDDTPRVRSRMLTSSLVLIDTSEVAHAVTTPSTTVNTVHAAVVREVLRGLQADDVLPLRRSPDVADHLVRDLGIITPYRDQVRRLTAQVDERFGDAPRGVVNTIHSFQGSERPVVVLDTVEHAASPRLGRFYEGVDLRSTTTRLLNVAVSRAQDHLVVVADPAVFRARTRPDSPTQRLIARLLDHAQVIPATDLIPTRTAADLASLHDDDLTRPAFFTADETPRAVAWDIGHARSSVAIYSAFISSATLKQRMAELRDATRRGVAVTVWTREATLTERPREIRTLTDIGVTVQNRDQMHEKVIVIDDAIVWHGSYNYLAHTRATELMLRMHDPAAARDARSAMHRSAPTKAASAWSTPPRGQNSSPDRVLLAVPYPEKDDAKRLGARWDRDAKKWWVTPDHAASGAFDRWR